MSSPTEPHIRPHVAPPDPLRLRLNVVCLPPASPSASASNWKPSASASTSPARRSPLASQGQSDTSSTDWPRTRVVAMAKGYSRRRNLEILSRLPPKSLCCCKCVSLDWYYLISLPDNFKKFPQTLAGFFFDTEDRGRYPPVAHHFQNVHGGAPLIDPCFSFLPPEFNAVRLVDSCNGLLLCSSKTPSCHFVCNPATESWAMLPGPGIVDNPLCLAFDRDISSNFHIFQIMRNEMSAEVGTNIYLSKTGEWSYKDGAWNHGNFTTSHVFHHGMMHYVGSSVIMAVDTEGKTGKIPLPDDTNFRDKFGDVGQSQGHLYYISQRVSNLEASVWFLENYDVDEWTLKHSMNVAQLLNVGNQRVYAYHYIVISGHPDCSLIYFADLIHNILMAYDVGRNEVHEADVFGSFGQGTFKSSFPYVALYKETLV